MKLRMTIQHYGHICRADGIEKKMMLGMVKRKRRRRRPKSKWLKEISEALQMFKRELERTTDDHTRWRQIAWKAA